MAKEVSRPSKDPSATNAGIDLLRSIAAYPHESIAVGATRMRHRTIDIRRNGLGQILESLEHTEETEIVSLDGQWSN